MGKIFLKLATLKISVRFNIQCIREEHNKDMNAAKNNGTTETIEAHEKLYQILKDKKLISLNILTNDTCLCNNFRHCNIVLMKIEWKQRNYAETIQVLEKYLKLKKAARRAADNSTCLHWDSFEINTYKSQYNESVLSCWS